MTDPVNAADGHTYERAAMERWLAKGKTTSPKTGAPLEMTAIFPNHAMRRMIIEWHEKQTERAAKAAALAEATAAAVRAEAALAAVAAPAMAGRGAGRGGRGVRGAAAGGAGGGRG